MATATTPPQKHQVPTRPGKPFWGSLEEFRRDGLGIFIRAAEEQGDVVRIRFGPNSLYQVNHPDGVQQILQSNNRNYGRQSYGNEIIKLVTGLNLFTSDGDYWLRQRRLMQPAFHRRQIEGFGKIMTDATLRMLDRWESAIGNSRTLDMHEEMMRITTEVVGRALFSVDLSAETSVLGKAFLTSTDYINFRFKVPMYWPLFVPTPRNRAVNQAIRDFQRILQEMIDDRRQSGTRYDDLMDMLMEVRYEDTGQGMDDEQLRNELGVVIGAGQETTSNLLTWVFYLLAEHPDVEATLLNEIDETLNGQVPSMDDLPRLPYLQKVIDEAMRMYPPAWALSSRNLIEDDQILGYHIPKGALVFIVPYILHRDPRFWNEPEKFDPERFSPERSATQHKYAYVPFGAGPRKCIGNTFALFEAQLILATILQRIRLRMQPGYEVVPDPVFTLRVRGGLPMYPEARQVLT